MVQRFCDQCGEPLGPNARFCPGCGVSVIATSGSPTQQEPRTTSSSEETHTFIEAAPGSDPSQPPPRRASSENFWSFLLDGSGDSSQGRFALVILPHMAIWITLAVLAQSSAAFAIAYWLYWLPGAYIAFVAVIRRFHNLGKSGWWSLLMLVPLVNFGTLIVLFLAPGKRIEGEDVTCPECHLLSPHHLNTCTLRHPHLQQ